jgi:hypothetical protein
MAETQIIRLCEVLSVTDDKAGLRIKVRLEPEDNDCKYIDDLPYCFPLLPKLIHLNPKVGECVMIILANQKAAKGNRFFIGPVISQQYFLNYDRFRYQSRALLAGNNFATPLPDPRMDSENDGSIPDREDIALQGRQNADVVLKDNEVRIRCGFKKNPTASPINTLEFNREDLAYVQMKYKQMKDEKNKDYYSMINIVADRINLLSHDSRTNFTLNDRESLITDEEQLNIEKNAHPLVYGDELIDFLKQLIEVIKTHVHTFPLDPPCFTTPQTTVLSKDLDTMLSKSIKCN